MAGAVLLNLNTARAKKEYTTKDGLSFCPIKRKNQYVELTPEEGQELFRQLTRGDEEEES